MSTFDNPFDPKHRLTRSGCACGRHVSQIEHERDAAPALQCTPVESEDKRYQGVVASAVMRAVFPQDAARRAFLKSVGASTALAAISQFFPLATATEVFAQGGAVEKKDLKVGFIPITCATPIIMAKPMGFYEKHGLNGEVIRTAGRAVIRDKRINKEYDAAHMLSPMPIAISLGVGSNAIPYTAPAIENINGQAITLAIKHKDKRDPKDWKGMKFAVPFDFTMHNNLLRYYVAVHGIDPDQDVQIRAVPPPEMVANVRADNIDGFLGPDPMNQRAVFDGVGFIQILTGTFADGLGSVKTVPNRVDFDPFPWESFAIWIMTQMKRWGQLKGDVDYAGVAKQVFLATDTTRLMKEVGLTPPAATTKSFAVMGKTFDPGKPEDYIKSFAIKRA